MRTVFRLVIILLMAHALYRFLPPYYHDERFETDLKQTASTWRDVTDEQVTENVLELAAKHRVPITRDNVTVSQVRDHILIDVAYSLPIEWIPGFKYPWKFGINLDVWVFQPKKVGIPQRPDGLP